MYAASPGQFMLDTNSQVFQTVLKGNSNILTLAGAGASVPAGYVISKSVVLPAEFSAFSRLITSCVYTTSRSGAGSFDEGSITGSYLKWRVSGGVLVITLTFIEPDGNSSITSDTYTYDANWSIYRAIF